VGFFTFLELEEYLSRVLGRRVDLVTKNALKPAIKEAVLQHVVYV
jgi:predicted nucleotidyltransferase